MPTELLLKLHSPLGLLSWLDVGGVISLHAGKVSWRSRVCCAVLIERQTRHTRLILYHPLLECSCAVRHLGFSVRNCASRLQPSALMKYSLYFISVFFISTNIFHS